jgi:hypothetical protein
MNYGQIRTQFKAILNRSDCTDALADTFISQGIARSQRVLRIPANEKSLATTVGPTFTGVAVPNDLIEVITFDCDGKKVNYLPVQRWLELDQDAAGTPEYWTRIGTNFKFKPLPTQGKILTLYYYGDFAAFTSDSTETALSVLAPDLIIYGGLGFAADYFLDERKDIFEQRYMMSAQELQEQAYNTDGAGSVQPAYDLGGY